MSRAECAFDRVLQPGESFTLPQPLRIALADHALRERLDVDARPVGGVADIDDGKIYRLLEMDAVNTADFAVRGSRVARAVGETVKASLTFRNKGPGWLGNLGSVTRSPWSTSRSPRVSPSPAHPPGATPVRRPTAATGRGVSALRVYVCEMPYWVLENTVRTFRFDLRIDAVVPDAKGQVALRPVITGTGFPHDPRPGNNTGWVTVNPTPAA